MDKVSCGGRRLQKVIRKRGSVAMVAVARITREAIGRFGCGSFGAKM